jgi:hypothetical protein
MVANMAEQSTMIGNCVLKTKHYMAKAYRGSGSKDPRI